MAVGPPFEILELGEGERRVLTVEGAELGEMVINPRDGRPARTISVLRLRVPRSEKPTVPGYWDLTSQLLIADLTPIVTAEGALPRRVALQKVGTGPAARFTLRDMGRL